MRDPAYNTTLRWLGKPLALLLMAAPVWAQQQSPAPAVVPAPAASPIAKGPVQERGTAIDGVVAVVNGDVILESDVDEERRFENIQPYRGAAEFSRDRAVQRLIDRALLLQQAALEADQIAVSDDELDKQIQTLRRDIPACRQQYHCDTDDGWAKYLLSQGFTVPEFRSRWRNRMEVLRLTEVRFRSGIHISDDEIKNYYEKMMLPEYEKQRATPPKLETISQRIEEVLLQQQVGSLLRDWLQSLRAQGSVWVMKPGEVAP